MAVLLLLVKLSLHAPFFSSNHTHSALFYVLCFIITFFFLLLLFFLSCHSSSIASCHPLPFLFFFFTFSLCIFFYLPYTRLSLTLHFVHFVPPCSSQRQTWRERAVPVKCWCVRPIQTNQAPQLHPVSPQQLPMDLLSHGVKMHIHTYRQMDNIYNTNTCKFCNTQIQWCYCYTELAAIKAIMAAVIHLSCFTVVLRGSRLSYLKCLDFISQVSIHHSDHWYNFITTSITNLKC